MSAEKRWRLVCYDVRDPVRYRKVFKIIRGAGESVQYSVFRCRLDDRGAERLRWRLSKVMDPEDALLIIDLCPSCSRKVVARNHVKGWELQSRTFRIVETAHNQSTSAARRPNHGSVDGVAVADVKCLEPAKRTTDSRSDADS